MIGSWFGNDVAILRGKLPMDGWEIEDYKIDEFEPKHPYVLLKEVYDAGLMNTMWERCNVKIGRYTDKRRAKYRK